jgi:hypothetical protein
VTEPDFSRGYLRIPLTVWLPLYCRGPLTRRQLQLVSVVIRESWGWQTRSGQVHLWTRPLPVRQFSTATGLSTDHLRRDLDRLLALGVLRRRGERYQFAGEVALGITRGPAAPQLRRVPPEPPAAGASSALPLLATKKRERKQRNVLLKPEANLSPVGENSSSPTSQRSPSASAGPAGLMAGASERLVHVVATFVGPLSRSQQVALQSWIEDAGVAATWQALAPGFGRGAVFARQHLCMLLADRGQSC